MVNIDTSCCSRGIRGACEKGSQWQSALSLLKAAGLPGRKNCRKRPSKHSKNDGDIRWGTFTFSWSIIVTIRFGVCWKEAFMISFAVAEASGMFTFLVLVLFVPSGSPLASTIGVFCSVNQPKDLYSRRVQAWRGAAEEGKPLSANVGVLANTSNMWMDGWMDGCMDGWMDGWMDR